MVHLLPRRGKGERVKEEALSSVGVGFRLVDICKKKELFSTWYKAPIFKYGVYESPFPLFFIAWI
jgi:hypothetical protein